MKTTDQLKQEWTKDRYLTSLYEMGQNMDLVQDETGDGLKKLRTDLPDVYELVRAIAWEELSQPHKK